MVGDHWNSWWFNANGVDYGDGRLNPHGNLACSGYPGNRCPLANGGEPARWHNEGANYGHVDGHAKWYEPEMIYPANATDATRDGFWGVN